MEQYQIQRDLFDRKILQKHGLKIANNLAYANAWVVRKVAPGGAWQIVQYFATREEAESWLAAQRVSG